jgi:tRNA dimethylallyltransferase
MLRARLAGEPSADLVERLSATDPDAAAMIDPDNVRRVVRALEVIELTGERFSAFRTSWDQYESRYVLDAFGIQVQGDELATKIAARTARMIDDGLVDEVRALLGRGLRHALTASRAIAYREIVAYLDGDISLDRAIELIEQATRQYARRQMTWFRRDPRIRWIDRDGAAETILRAVSQNGARDPRDAG